MNRLSRFYFLVCAMMILMCTGTLVEGGTSRVSPLLRLPVNMTALPGGAQTRQLQWKSRLEYNAFLAATNEKDPGQKISLCEAFLQQFPNSDFIDLIDLAMAQAEVQLGKSDQAEEATRSALRFNPDNLNALTLFSYIFPFTLKMSDPAAATKLAEAEANARHGLDLLARTPMPPNVNSEQFAQAVKRQRSVHNNALGFVALQRGDYASAASTLQTAVADNPSDVYTNYRLGLAYLYSQPRDVNHAIWYLARASSLAAAAQNPSAGEINKFATRVYTRFHGNEQGLTEILNQAAASPNPPEGFSITATEPPPKTGDAMVDAFNTLAYPMKLGGENVQRSWDAIRGQPLGLGGQVQSIEPGPTPGSYCVRVAVLPQSKAKDGVFDLEVLDEMQPDVQYLRQGDLVTVLGAITEYRLEPNFALRIKGTVTSNLPSPPPGHHRTIPAPLATGQEADSGWRQDVPPAVPTTTSPTTPSVATEHREVTVQPAPKAGPTVPACSKKALQEYEVIQLLEGFAPPLEMIAVIKKDGVCFQLTPKLESMLKEKGATDDVLDALRQAQPAQP